jgi:magnesium-transporting ATPase (P-type)
VEFGPNRIDRLPSTPAVTRFLAQFTHFFALLLWAAAFLAAIADREQPGQGLSTLAVAIVGVIMLAAEETRKALVRRRAN